MLSSCVPRTIYYWGGYSSSLYGIRTSPGDESREAHKKKLESIISISKRKNLKVAPGIHCELGYIFFKYENYDKAIEYFSIEEKLYPESSIFINKLKNEIKTVRGHDES
jgi:hypothetical protein